MTITMIRIEPDSDGFHDNQTTYDAIIPIPEGYALLPDTVANPDTKNYPYANITTVKVRKEDAPPGMNLEIFGDRDEIDVVNTWEEIVPIINEPTIRTDRLYRPGEIFQEKNGTMYKIWIEIPANGAIAVGTNCEIVTMNELLESN